MADSFSSHEIEWKPSEQNLAHSRLHSDAGFWSDVAKGTLSEAGRSIDFSKAESWHAIGTGAALGIGLKWMCSTVRPTPTRIVGQLITSAIGLSGVAYTGQTLGELSHLKDKALKSGDYASGVSAAQALTGKFLADNVLGAIGGSLGHLSEPHLNSLVHFATRKSPSPYAAAMVPAGAGSGNVSESPFYMAMSKASEFIASENKQLHRWEANAEPATKPAGKIKIEKIGEAVVPENVKSAIRETEAILSENKTVSQWLHELSKDSNFTSVFHPDLVGTYANYVKNLPLRCQRGDIEYGGESIVFKRGQVQIGIRDVGYFENGKFIASESSLLNPLHSNRPEIAWNQVTNGPQSDNPIFHDEKLMNSVFKITKTAVPDDFAPFSELTGTRAFEVPRTSPLWSKQFEEGCRKNRSKKSYFYFQEKVDPVMLPDHDPRVHRLAGHLSDAGYVFWDNHKRAAQTGLDKDGNLKMLDYGATLPEDSAFFNIFDNK